MTHCLLCHSPRPDEDLLDGVCLVCVEGGREAGDDLMDEWDDETEPDDDLWQDGGGG